MENSGDAILGGNVFNSTISGDATLGGNVFNSTIINKDDNADSGKKDEQGM